MNVKKATDEELKGRLSVIESELAMKNHSPATLSSRAERVELRLARDGLLTERQAIIAERAERKAEKSRRDGPQPSGVDHLAIPLACQILATQFLDFGDIDREAAARDALATARSIVESVLKVSRAR